MIAMKPGEKSALSPVARAGRGRRAAGGRAPYGFTLIELMIVVAVVAILAAVAIPAYNEQVRKSRRGQVKADIVEYAQMAERFHTVNNSYVGFSLPTDESPRDGATAYYSLTLTPAVTPNTFTIVASPLPGPQVADRCGTLTINQAGVKTHSRGSESECQFGSLAP